MRPLRRLWAEHSLVIILLAVLLSMMTATLLLGRAMYDFEAGRVKDVGFWHWWVFITVLSLEADVFGAIALVVFTKHFRERGSPESGDHLCP